VNESEFRDWSRRAQGAFEARLKALEGKYLQLSLAPPRVREPEIAANVKELIEKVAERVRSGQVTALGIAFVTEDDGPWTGFAHEKWERATLAGVAGQLWFELLTRPVNDGGFDAPEHAGQVGPGVSEPGGKG
jgi:hypothetical protein